MAKEELLCKELRTLICNMLLERVKKPFGGCGGRKKGGHSLVRNFLGVDQKERLFRGSLKKWASPDPGNDKP